MHQNVIWENNELFVQEIRNRYSNQVVVTPCSIDNLQKKIFCSNQKYFLFKLRDISLNYTQTLQCMF